MDINSLKSELQGNSGLIKLIREKHLPDTKQMSMAAQLNYENEKNDFSNIDMALDELLKIEYSIYLRQQKLITDTFIAYLDEDADSKKFPVTRAIIDEYKSQVKQNENPTKILTGLVNIVILLADSNRQSRVSRSGSSLMHHISYLLNKVGFVFERDYQREFILGEGCKLDFFFPNLETYKEEPKNCCAVACQTTSNDRFRLTFAQMPSNTRNRACTAIGSENFGEKLGPLSLTANKLIEAKENDVKFVILAKALNEKLIESKTVMSYQEWFEELLMLKQFWK